MNIIEACDPGFRAAATIGAFKGAVKDLGNSEYHSLHTYWSSTDLKVMADLSPAHFKAIYRGAAREPRKQTEAMILGSILHTLLLSPAEYEKEFFILPDLNYRTNEGKAAKQEFLAANPGKTLITDEQLATAHLMKASVEGNDDAMKILDGMKKEVSFFWRCPFSGLPFRCKVDGASSKIFAELKNTRDASPEGFARQACDLHYDLSLVHYREGIKQVMGFEPPAVFICVENEAPHVCQVYKVGDGFWQTGHVKWLDSVSKLEKGLKKDYWPTWYPVGMESAPDLQPPPWQINKLMKGPSDGV